MPYAAVTLLLAMLFAVPQFPPPPPPGRSGRDVPKARTGTSRIVGRVLRAENGAPVRRASVLITGEGAPEGRDVMSDAEGRYDSGELPAGTYRVTVTKPGLINAEFGAKSEGDPGQPVKLAQGERRDAVDLFMMRGGSIAGRVLDEYADPVAFASVRVQRERVVEGVRRLELAGSAVAGQTDDLGQYRVFGLPPGSYFVSASLPIRGGDEVDAQRNKPVTTYYPGTASLNDARPIDLAAGQDATGIDFPLALIRTVRLSGTCLDAEGRPLTPASVTARPVMTGTRGAGVGTSAPVENDGSFSINGLGPGEYTVVAWSQFHGAGVARVSIGNADVSGLLIQASPGSTLSGRITFDDNQARRAVTRRVSLSVPPADPNDPLATSGRPSVGATEVRDDGTFMMTGLIGDHFVSATPPDGWAVKAVLQGSRDITDTPVSFDGREAVSGVQVVLTDRLTHVVATVSPSPGSEVAEDAEVVVAADDPARWKAGLGARYKRRMFSQDGSAARFDGLPPGEYFAVAVGNVRAPDMLLDPDVLEQLQRSGQRFTLKEGETRQLSLKVVRQQH